MFFELLILAILLLATLAVFGIGLWLTLLLSALFVTRVPYVPVRHSVAGAVKDMVSRSGAERVVFYDIGSGDGRVVRQVADIENAAAIGIEVSPAAFILAKLKSSHRRARFLFADARKHNFADATHIFMYLLPEVVNTFNKKLSNELKKGSTVICFDFPISGRDPVEVQAVYHNKKSIGTLYRYEI